MHKVQRFLTVAGSMGGGGGVDGGGAGGGGGVAGSDAVSGVVTVLSDDVQCSTLCACLR